METQVLSMMGYDICPEHIYIFLRFVKSYSYCIFYLYLSFTVETLTYKFVVLNFFYFRMYLQFTEPAPQVICKYEIFISDWIDY